MRRRATANCPRPWMTSKKAPMRCGPWRSTANGGRSRRLRTRKDHCGHQRHAARRRGLGVVGHSDGRVDVHRGTDAEGALAEGKDERWHGGEAQYRAIDEVRRVALE